MGGPQTFFGEGFFAEFTVCFPPPEFSTTPRSLSPKIRCCNVIVLGQMLVAAALRTDQSHQRIKHYQGTPSTFHAKVYLLANLSNHGPALSSLMFAWRTLCVPATSEDCCSPGYLGGGVIEESAGNPSNNLASLLVLATEKRASTCDT